MILGFWYLGALGPASILKNSNLGKWGRTTKGFCVFGKKNSAEGSKGKYLFAYL